MQDEFNNRLSMFQTTLGVLNSAEHQSPWQGQPPTIFTTDASLNLIAAYNAARIIPGTGGGGNGGTAPETLEIDTLTQNGDSVDIGYVVDTGTSAMTQTVPLPDRQYRSRLRQQRCRHTAATNHPLQTPRRQRLRHNRCAEQEIAIS
jgi:hypothetical protein